MIGMPMTGHDPGGPSSAQSEKSESTDLDSQKKNVDQGRKGRAPSERTVVRKKRPGASTPRSKKEALKDVLGTAAG